MGFIKSTHTMQSCHFVSESNPSAMSWPIFLLIYFLLRHEVRLDKCFGNKLYFAIILELIVGSCPERYYILHINTEKTLIWENQ